MVVQHVSFAELLQADTTSPLLAAGPQVWSDLRHSVQELLASDADAITLTTPMRDVLKEIFSFWFLPALIAGILLFGWSRGVKVYESLVEGGREGFNVALRIIPFLVAILRYALLVELGRGSAPEDLLLDDRQMQVVGLIWVALVGAGFYFGGG